MTDLAITELELTPGIWTPHAAILCLVCHKKAFGGKWGFGSVVDIEDDRFEPVPLDDEMDSTVAHCDECGKAIWMNYTIAWEQRAVAALKEKGYVNAHMSQTGGMCSAAELLLDSDEDGGCKFIWITESEDVDRPHNDPTFLVGFYTNDGHDNEEMEGAEDPLTLDEAVAKAEAIWKAGRYA